jgi:small subunit ribosomal protein S1
LTLDAGLEGRQALISFLFLLVTTGVLMFYKDKQKEKKRASKVKRPLQFKDRANLTLSELVVGSTADGVVISITPFGAYVDIGSECDGLLHVSQLSRETFVEHPRQMLEPGQHVQVRIRAVLPALKKLQLTMLDAEVDGSNDEEGEEGISLEDVAVDDELWGELSRVTDFGAYVDVGARVAGFLHFMDHPAFTWPENKGVHPRSYMKVGDRVRVWVSNVDLDRQRIKLTAYRPRHLPGPRREVSY